MLQIIYTCVVALYKAPEQRIIENYVEILIASKVEDYSESGLRTQDVLKSHLKSARTKASALMASDKRFAHPPYSETIDCLCGKGHRIKVTVLSAGFVKRFGYSVASR